MSFTRENGGISGWQKLELWLNLHWGVRLTIAVTGAVVCFWLPFILANGLSLSDAQTLNERLWQMAPVFLLQVIGLLFLVWTVKLVMEMSNRSGKLGNLVAILLMFSFSVFILNSLLTDWSGPEGSGLLRWLFWIAATSLFLFVGLAMFRLRRWVVGLAMKGDYDRALRISRKLSWLSGYGRPFQGQILLRAGRYSEARACLKPSAFDEKGRPRLTNPDLYFYAVALMNEDRDAEAQALLEAAIQVPQKMDYFRIALADCLLSQNKDASRACELVEQVMANMKKKGRIAQQRTIVGCIAVHAWALACCGRREESEAQLQEALSGSKGFEAREVAALKTVAGVTWQTLGDLERARAAFQEAAKLYPHGDVGLRARRKLAELGAEI
jgi:hypothetical protein